MAIKERKQITGTTEQINAYEGHEGQIVWDKDKKTLVGMSGTAGTNYPLAQQAYVDSQFLPLTGGDLSGNISFKMAGGVALNKFPDIEEVIIYSQDSTKNWTGGVLSCRGHSGSIEEQRGSFALGARSKDNSISSFLLGTPAGSLLWQGNEVLRITGADNGWVRFNPNLQICFGQGRTTSNGVVTLSYGAPFTYVLSHTATVIGDSGASGTNWNVVANPISGGAFNIWTFGNGVLTSGVSFYWCAFGYYY